MAPIIPCLWVAGLLHLLIASANFAAARMLDYRGNLARVTPLVRDIFWVQNLYIELILAAFAGACFFFAEELAGRTSLGRCFSAFLALFWGLRLLIQVGYYDVAIRRQHRWIDALFVIAQVYLTGVFLTAFSGGAK
jgi:hypothetical protein